MKRFVLPFLFLALILPASAEDWIDLFADGNLSQWVNLNGDSIPDVWSLEDGVLHFKGRTEGKAANLITKESFDSFELEFEWKISEGGNSGVKYRTQKGLGLEYQLLDDANHKDNEIPSHRTGSLYDMKAAPDDKPAKPVGEWNQSKIIVQGTHIEHWLNGAKLVEIEYGSAEWNERFQASKYKKMEGFASKAGPILLQDHTDPVWFRNVRIRRLDS